MMEKKRKWISWLVLFTLSIAFTVLWLVVIQFYRDYQNIPSNHLIGNRPSTVAALNEQGFPFSFLVIGDTTGSETAETLIELALKEANPSFIIILGDFVKKPDLWNHRFFLTEMTAEIKPPFPVFLVPGNHDIDYASKIKSKQRRVTPEVYESLYGSRNFDFIFNQCLFIISEINPRTPLGYLSYLQETLSREGEGKRHIFVFIHIPMKGLGPNLKASHPDEETVSSLIEAYKGVTCFFGDYHGHLRVQKRGVNYIITGGGGGRLKKWQPNWGKFNHILRVTVDQDKVAEEVITVQGQIGLEDRFEEWAFANVFPAIQRCAWILYLIFVFLLMGSVFLFIKFVKTVFSKPR